MPNQMLKADIDAITTACEEDKNCPFHGFSVDGSSCTFKFMFSPDMVTTFTFYFGDYYPTGTIVTVNGSDGHSTDDIKNERLPIIFNDISKELHHEMNVKLCEPEKATSQKIIQGDNSDSEEEYDFDYEDDDDYGLCSSDEEDLNNEDVDEVPAMNAALSHDIEKARKKLGEDVIQIFDDKEERVSIDLCLKYDNEDTTVLNMWKAGKNEDISIQLVVNRTSYRATEIRKVEVSQRSSNKPFLLGMKIKGMIQNMINAKWSESSADNYKLDPTSEKDFPALTDGFLVWILMYCKQRLSTLHHFCVACDTPLICGPVDKPSICEKVSCSNKIQTFKARGMSDCDVEKIGGPQIPALLVTMAKAACTAEERQVRKGIFRPFPAVADPSNRDTLALNPENPDMNRCKEALSKLSDLSSESTLTYAQLQNLDDDVSYPLLKWLIESNQSTYVPLSDMTRLDFMKAKHQFLLTRSPPAKEVIFREAKRKYGSRFAFHGSPIENWHSIIRNGLMNASGTQLELNGAAHGSGVYMSPQIELALSYCKHKNQGISQQLSAHTSLTCLTLVEVIDHPELNMTNNGIHDIWVITNPDHVCTRFIFVFENDATNLLESAEKINISNNADIQLEIQRVMLHYNTQL